MFSKISKIIKWNIVLQRMKSHGDDCRIGIDFSIHGERYIMLGDHFRGGKHLIIDAYDTYNGVPTGFVPKIVIGNDVTFADYCYLSCINEINIGNGTLLGSNVFICDNYHGKSNKEEIDIIPSERNLYSRGKVSIGKNVWIGKNVCIMPNVAIGDYVTVGANAVVTHDIPRGSVAVGVPARVVRKI